VALKFVFHTSTLPGILPSITYYTAKSFSKMTIHFYLPIMLEIWLVTVFFMKFTLQYELSLQSRALVTHGNVFVHMLYIFHAEILLVITIYMMNCRQFQDSLEYVECIFIKMQVQQSCSVNILNQHSAP